MLYPGLRRALGTIVVVIAILLPNRLAQEHAAELAAAHINSNGVGLHDSRLATLRTSRPLRIKHLPRQNFQNPGQIREVGLRRALGAPMSDGAQTSECRHDRQHHPRCHRHHRD